MNTIENTPQEVEPSGQSPCPSNWNDYLHVKNDTDDKGAEQTEPLTDVNPDQPTTLQGTHVLQDLHADSNAILRLPKSVPKALTIGKGKGKCNINDTMPIVVYGDATQLWEQMPSTPKARPLYMTWALVNPKDRHKMMQNITKDLEIEHEISIFIFIDVGVLIYICVLIYKFLLCQIA